jgi:mRNA-degrading endonuclease HigB of HigAB toxin-antitoxin module
MREWECNMGKHIRKTQEQFEKEVYSLVGREYEVLSDYTTAKQKIKLKHTLCNTIYEVTPTNFLNGRRCPNSECVKKKFVKFRKTTEEFKYEVNNLFRDEYQVLGEYIGNNNKIKMKHNVCNSTYYAYPSNLLRGHGCLKCYGRFQQDTDSFKKKVFKLVGDEYEVLGNYTKARKKILIKHTTCNSEYEVTPDSFLNKGSRCPHCSSSKGEKIIKQWLEYNDISFYQQKEFEGLLGVGNGNLSYDFYLQNQNILIEYQGEFHDGTAYQQTEEEFIIQQEHDKRKKEYAKLHNIDLLEIWYWDFDNIEKLLHKEIIQNNLIHI